MKFSTSDKEFILQAISLVLDQTDSDQIVSFRHKAPLCILSVVDLNAPTYAETVKTFRGNTAQDLLDNVKAFLIKKEE